MNWREFFLTIYYLFVAIPVAITLVVIFEGLDRLANTFGRDVPEFVENVFVWILEWLSKPVPDVSDSIPD